MFPGFLETRGSRPVLSNFSVPCVSELISNYLELKQFNETNIKGKTIITHIILMDFILITRGKEDPSPFKSVILLKCQNRINYCSRTQNHEPERYFETTYKSVKFVRAEIEGGIGP